MLQPYICQPGITDQTFQKNKEESSYLEKHSNAVLADAGSIHLGVVVVGQKPVVSTLTNKSILPILSLLSSMLRCDLNSSIVELDTDMSLNIPSNLEVNWQPHSV